MNAEESVRICLEKVSEKDIRRQCVGLYAVLGIDVPASDKVVSTEDVTKAVHMAVAPAIKNVGILLDKHLIAMERTSCFDVHGLKWNGNNLYTILPTQCSVDEFYQQRFHQLEFMAKLKRPRQRKAGHTGFGQRKNLPRYNQ